MIKRKDDLNGFTFFHNVIQSKHLNFLHLSKKRNVSSRDYLSIEEQIVNQ